MALPAVDNGPVWHALPVLFTGTADSRFTTRIQPFLPVVVGLSIIDLPMNLLNASLDLIRSVDGD